MKQEGQGAPTEVLLNNKRVKIPQTVRGRSNRREEEPTT
jgi:hypothetical protein